MADSIDVILVDGMGTPRLVPIICEQGELPPFVQFAREHRIAGQHRVARFDHWPGLVINGCAVYRQVEMGDPVIRFAYLKPVEQPFNGPRAV